MQLNLASGESLQAVMSGAANTTNPKVRVDYLQDGQRQSAWTSLSGATAVTLLEGKIGSSRVVTGITCSNIDAAAVTVTFNHVVGSSTHLIIAQTLQVGDTLLDDKVLDSGGNIKLGFSSTTTTFTGDVTLSDGKNLIFSGATGESELHIPDNLADALSVKIAAGADLITFDTSTGAIVIAFGASVRLNVLGSAQIGNATADLVGFHGATPTDQCAAYVQTFSTADRTHAARTATALTDNGGGTADGTVASQAAPTTLTDSTGLSGTHDDTLAATTVPGALTVTDGTGTNDGTIGAITDNASTITAVQELAAKINAIITLLGVMTQNDSDIGQKVIELVTLAGTAQNNTKEHTTTINALIVDLADTASFANSIGDDLQEKGIAA